MSVRRCCTQLMAALLCLALASRAAADGSKARVLSLPQLLEIARKNPPAVMAAWAQARSAEAQVQLAAAALKPTLASTASAMAGAIQTQILYGESQIPPGLVFPGIIPTLALDAGLTLRVPVSDFGRTELQTQASKRAAQVAGHVARNVERMAMSTAANAFFLVLSDQDLLEQLRATLVQHEHELELTRSLVRNGIRPAFDQQRAEVAVEAARADVAALEGAWQGDQASLLAALAFADASDASLALHLIKPEARTVDDDPSHASRVALEASPALEAARAQVAQATLQLRAWQAANRPLLTANVSAGVRYANHVRSDGISTQGVASLVLSLPWIDPMMSANVASTGAQLAAAEAELARVTHAVRVEAEQAALAVRTTRAALVQSTRVSEGAATALDQAQVLYEKGSVSLLDLLAAQDKDTKARVATVRARLALELSTVQLLIVTNQLTDWSTQTQSP